MSRSRRAQQRGAENYRNRQRRLQQQRHDADQPQQCVDEPVVLTDATRRNLDDFYNRPLTTLVDQPYIVVPSGRIEYQYAEQGDTEAYVPYEPEYMANWSTNGVVTIENIAAPAVPPMSMSVSEFMDLIENFRQARRNADSSGGQGRFYTRDAFQQAALRIAEQIIDALLEGLDHA